MTSMSADPYLADFVDVELQGQWHCTQSGSSKQALSRPWDFFSVEMSSQM